MQLVRTRPLKQLLDVEKEFSKMLDRSWSLAPVLAETSAVDVYTEDGQLVTEVALPDFKKDEIEVKATGEGLEISAERKEKEEKTTKDRRYLLRESNQSYWRRLSLPPEAKTDDVKCTLKDGKLSITMPLETSKKTKTIAIE